MKLPIRRSGRCIRQLELAILAWGSEFVKYRYRLAALTPDPYFQTVPANVTQ